LLELLFILTASLLINILKIQLA